MRGGDVIVELASRCGDTLELKLANPSAQALTFPPNRIAQNIELSKSLRKSVTYVISSQLDVFQAP